MKNIAVITISLLIAAPLSGRAADAKTNWANNSWQVFVQVNNNTTAGAVDAKIKNFLIIEIRSNTKIEG